jgi:hypothetical protein
VEAERVSYELGGVPPQGTLRILSVLRQILRRDGKEAVALAAAAASPGAFALSSSPALTRAPRAAKVSGMRRLSGCVLLLSSLALGQVDPRSLTRSGPSRYADGGIIDPDLHAQEERVLRDRADIAAQAAAYQRQHDERARQYEEAERESLRAKAEETARRKVTVAAEGPRALVASLADAWDANEVRAEETWLGKDLVIVGRVGKIFANDGTPYITIVSSGTKGHATAAAVVCLVDPAAARRLDPDAAVAALGTLTKLETPSLFRYSWALSECTLLDGAAKELAAACRKVPGAGECKGVKK